MPSLSKHFSRVHQTNRSLKRKPTGNARTLPVLQDELSPDDIIIACVVSRNPSLTLFIQYIHVVSWAQLVQGKLVCVLRISQMVTLA